MTDTADVKSDSAQAHTGEERGFEAEVSKLLHMMVHSVYSEREIFLRELISNAADACDKRRYEALTKPELAPAGDYAISLTLDKDKKTLTVSDTGIGMSKDELVENLGTIARSGTGRFMEALSGDTKKDVQLIGQFGVGFYSVFMVADRVEVTSLRAGEDAAHRWSSSGEGTYRIEAAEKAVAGTDIVLHLKSDAEEYLERYRLESIVRTYSDHIAHPILLRVEGEKDEDGNIKPAEQINDASALWTRPKADITDEQYTEFYRHVSHAFDKPALTLHYRVEGLQDYTNLLFIPDTRPMDLFDPARKSRVKLFVRRVFITDDTTDMLPGWLRFLRGVIDSQDLPLNLSREMLQNNPHLRKMAGAVTKRVLSELTKLADKDAGKFEGIWANFGAVIKEGLYEDFERRDDLLKLARFKSTHADGWTTLADYVARMKDKQSAIYYVTGTDAESVKRSPQIEGFKARGLEVLLLSDPVDDFWLQMVPEFDGKAFKSVTRGASDLKAMDESDPNKAADKKKDEASEGALAQLTVVMKDILGDRVQDVRTSDRLTDTAACLVADDSGMDMHLQKVLKAHNQLDTLSAPILEINPSHSLVKKLSEKAASDGASTLLADPVWLLLDQARILEGEAPVDVTAFTRRLAAAVDAGLA